MALSAICSGNFHQLRKGTGNNYRINFLKYHTGLIYDKVFDNRRWSERPLNTRVEVRGSKSGSNQPCSIKRNLHSGTLESSTNIVQQSDLQRLKSLQSYNVKTKGSEVKIRWPATIFVFDIETTGFSRQYDRMIELALRDRIGGRNSTFQTLINPERKVLNTSIHGIRNDMVNSPSVPRFEELIPILLQWVESRQMPGKPVLWVGHNSRSFDVPFLIHEFRRCKAEIPDHWRFLDTRPLGLQLVDSNGSKLSSVSLDALREFYGIPLVGPAHRAMSDVNTLSHVLKRIADDLKLTVPMLLEKSFSASDLAKARQQ